MVAELVRIARPKIMKDWRRRRIVITAGPTREKMDPVRYLSNESSGKMGWALAEAARDAGRG
jgi:phosphopantothenoylcysteine decarboxylase/phosphopantothenate--cysteine ligase